MKTSYYVLRLFDHGIKPIVVEVFPLTSEGHKDAIEFADILARNNGHTYIVVS